jgi:hypothetical protein
MTHKYNDKTSNQNKTKSHPVHSQLQPGLHLLMGDLLKYKYLILSVLAYCIIMPLLFHRVCLISIITGLPCPGCGITRALFDICTFHFVDAFAMNPSIYLWIPFLFYAFLCRYIFQKRLAHKNAIILTVCIATLIIYIIRMVLLYPNTIPMIYRSDNLLHFILQLFGLTA